MRHFFTLIQSSLSTGRFNCFCLAAKMILHFFKQLNEVGFCHCDAMHVVPSSVAFCGAFACSFPLPHPHFAAMRSNLPETAKAGSRNVMRNSTTSSKRPSTSARNAARTQGHLRHKRQHHLLRHRITPNSLQIPSAPLPRSKPSPGPCCAFSQPLPPCSPPNRLHDAHNDRPF